MVVVFVVVVASSECREEDKCCPCWSATHMYQWLDILNGQQLYEVCLLVVAPDSHIQLERISAQKWAGGCVASCGRRIWGGTERSGKINEVWRDFYEGAVLKLFW